MSVNSSNKNSSTLVLFKVACHANPGSEKNLSRSG